MGTKLSELPSVATMLGTDYLVGVASGVTSTIEKDKLLNDGSTYSRIIKVYADAINAGTYGLLYDGVSWDESADSYTLLGRSVNDPNYLSVQKAMRRCVVTDDGEIAYYLSPTNSAYKEDGTTASVLDGTDGQVMVEIPKFYYSYSYVGTTHTWKVSELPLPGFEIHPLFMSGTTELSKAFVGAYEGSVYDVSASKYVGGAGVYQTSCEFVASTKTIYCSALTNVFTNVVAGSVFEVAGTASNNSSVLTVVSSSAQSIVVSETIADEVSVASTTTILLKIDTTDTTGDKLASINAVAPVTLKTRAGFRALGKNRGTGWTQMTFEMASAVQVLYLVEYGSFYSQSEIGAGITNVTDWPTYNNYFPIAKTGNSNAIGNATGNTAGATACATEATKYLSYRGIENFFGHIWKWVDGININSNVAYKTNAIASFADDTASGYSLIGTLGNADGYQKTLVPVKGGILPKTVGSDGSHHITDYYYQSTGWRVVCLGGYSRHGASAGFFFWCCIYSSAIADRYVGARLGLLKS